MYHVRTKMTLRTSVFLLLVLLFCPHTTPQPLSSVTTTATAHLNDQDALMEQVVRRNWNRPSHFSVGQSSLTRNLRRSVPEDAVWSTCHHCAFDHALNRVILFDQFGALRQLTHDVDILLAKSRYDSFSGVQGNRPDKNVICENTRVFATIVERPLVTSQDCSRVWADGPIVLYNLINFRVGHLLADLIENIFYMRLQAEPFKIPATFILAALDGDPWSDTFQELFTILAGSSPILFSTFNALGGVTCMRDLHVGIDESKSYVSDGWAEVTNALLPLSHHYTAYQRVKTGFIGSLFLSHFGKHVRQQQEFQKSQAQPHNCHIVQLTRGIQQGALIRLAIRHIVNAAEVLEVLQKATSCSVEHALLDDMSFKDQFAAFQRGDLLVGLAGSGMHNAVFFKDNAVAITIMQKGWCSVRWWFERQMVLSNLWPLTLCDEPPLHREHFRWHRFGWLVGPWYTKETTSTVDIPLFTDVVQRASAIFSRRATSSNSTRTRSRRPFCTARSSMTGSCGVAGVQPDHENLPLHLIAAIGSDGSIVSSAANLRLSLVPMAVVIGEDIAQNPTSSQVDEWMQVYSSRLAFCSKIQRKIVIGLTNSSRHCLALNSTHEFSKVHLPARAEDASGVVKFWFELDGKLLHKSESVWSYDKKRTIDLLASMIANDWHLHDASAVKMLPASELHQCTEPALFEGNERLSVDPLPLHPFTIQHDLYKACARAEELVELFVRCVKCLVGAVAEVLLLDQKTKAGEHEHRQLLHVMENEVPPTEVDYASDSHFNTILKTKRPQISPSIDSGRTLVVYAYHDVNSKQAGGSTANLKFFIEHAVRQRSLSNAALGDHIFVLVCQGVPVPSFVPKELMIVLERENSGFDFEGWYHGVHAALAAISNAHHIPSGSVSTWMPMVLAYFSNFVFINSSVRGPYLPHWFHNLGVSWTVALTGRLDSHIKLVGTTMNRCGGNGGWKVTPMSCSTPHLQSMVFATDRVGLTLLFLPALDGSPPLFSERNPRGYDQTIEELELGMSLVIRNAGYNISAISMSELAMEVLSRQMDNNGLGLHGDLQFQQMYFGLDVNPLDSLFWKTNRGYISKATQKYDEWLNVWTNDRKTYETTKART